MLVRPLQPEKAYQSIIVTLVGIKTSLSAVQFLNAPYPISVIGFPLYVEGITTDEVFLSLHATEYESDSER